ncbi:MAG: hypothetical protein DRJ01_07695 [Bacteroidetes bacterium]|nr:MAG: hypothetical protein DRJ01_07695 [Bacteroidota bacterium]
MTKNANEEYEKTNNEEIKPITRNIKNWAKVVNMNVLAISKRCRKLKKWCFKMPNFSYCHRWASL